MRSLLLVLFVFAICAASRAQQTINLIVPVGHGAPVEAVAVSPNNKFVGSVGGDNLLIVWEVESGKVLRTIELDSALAAKSSDSRWWSLYFSSDSKLIGLTGRNKGLKFRVWDVESGSKLANGDGELISFTNENVVYSTYNNGQYSITSQPLKGVKTVLAENIDNDPLWLKYRLTTYVLFRDDNGVVFFLDAGTRKMVPIVQVSALEKHTFTFSEPYGLAIVAENGGSIHVYQHEKGLSTTLKGDYISLGKVQASTDGKYLRSDCLDKTRIWSLETFQEVKDISDIRFNERGTATQTHDSFEIVEKHGGVITVHDKVAGKELTVTFNGHHHFDNGRKILGYNGNDISIVDAKEAAIVNQFKSIVQRPVTSLSFDQSNAMLFCANGELRIVDFNQSKVQSTGQPAMDVLQTASNMLLLASDEARSLVTYDYRKQQPTSRLDVPVQRNLQATKDLSYILWSPDKTSSKVTLIKRLEGSATYSLPRTEQVDSHNSVLRLTDEGKIFSFEDNGTWFHDTDLETTSFAQAPTDLRKQTPGGNRTKVSFNHDASIALSSGDTSILYKLDRGALKEILATGTGLRPANVATISHDGNYITYAEAGNETTVVIAERSGGSLRVRNRLKGHLSPVVAVSISWDNKLLATSSSDNTIRLWRIHDGELLSTLRLLPNNEWAAYTPDGIFDASPGAMQQMYFVKGLETIDLSQLKDRFYEPNLLKKLLSDAESLKRNIRDLSKLDLYPEVTGSVDELKGVLTVNVANRGGGIGKIQVVVNGRELYADARELIGTPVAQMEDQRQVSVKIDLTKNKHVIWGERNFIGVKSSNKQSYLVSKTLKIIYDAPKRDVVIANQKPSLYAIVSGISDYENDDLDLKYASKDAEDFATAVEIAAPNLFEDRVYIKRFTSAGNERPSKQNLLNAFHDVASKAKPNDVLVIYFSGHGTNTTGNDSEFLYLTEEASTFNFTDPVIRKRGTISSSEITELLKSVAAQKQVMIIDACASGTVVENLMAKRDIPSETLKALDRMKDRVGTYIMTGCASDAVSYEASKFGQGLLTYSVLSAIRGAALRDEKFIDVLKLFQYCREEVPRLAENIGGIQEPKIFSPYGGDSFDIGLLSSSVEKERIPLSTPKPFFLRSNFQDEASFRDNLSFGKMLDRKLSNAASRGQESQLVFLDVSEFPGAYSLTGRYKIVDNSMKLDVKLFKGEAEVRNFQLEGVKGELDQLVDKLINDLEGIISQLSQK